MIDPPARPETLFKSPAGEKRHRTRSGEAFLEAFWTLDRLSEGIAHRWEEWSDWTREYMWMGYLHRPRMGLDSDGASRGKSRDLGSTIPDAQ
jgi:hypothetical protein